MSSGGVCTPPLRESDDGVGYASTGHPESRQTRVGDTTPLPDANPHDTLSSCTAAGGRSPALATNVPRRSPSKYPSGTATTPLGRGPQELSPVPTDRKLRFRAKAEPVWIVSDSEDDDFFQPRGGAQQPSQASQRPPLTRPPGPPVSPPPSIPATKD